MPNINFPSGPTAGTTYIFNSSKWTYNGVAWVLNGTIGPVGPTGSGSVTITSQEIAFGTGTGLTSSCNFRFDNIKTNLVSGYCSNIGGSSQQSSIIGGLKHSMDQSNFATIIGGKSSYLHNSAYGSIMGNYYSCLCDSPYGSIIGGSANKITHCSSLSTILGGSGNYIRCSPTGTILGGSSNYISSDVYGNTNAILNGVSNKIGQINSTYGRVYNSTIIGGHDNHIFGQDTIGYRTYNTTIIGGSINLLKCSSNSSIIGGSNNTAYCINNSALIGGDSITMTYVSNVVAVPQIMTTGEVPYGNSNTITGQCWKLGGHYYGPANIVPEQFIRIWINGTEYRIPIVR